MRLVLENHFKTCTGNQFTYEEALHDIIQLASEHEVSESTVRRILEVARQALGKQ